MHSYSQSSVRVENSKEAADNNVWMAWSSLNEVNKNRLLTSDQIHPRSAPSVMGLPDATTGTEKQN